MLTIRSLQTGYGKVQILRGIDMTVPEGRIVALLGGNGTGKSTLLRAVSGLIPGVGGQRSSLTGEVIQNRLRPDQSSCAAAWYPGDPGQGHPIRRMTVEENLRMLGAHIRSNGRRKILADDLDKDLRLLSAVARRAPLARSSGTLSGGEVQMLVIGRGLMANGRG